MAEHVHDLLIVGGGINGVAVARDAAGRGLEVLLCERGDLGGATSSSSSKMIHGGLRYLEHYQFGLVRESLRERELLLGNAPHLVRPVEFVLPHEDASRPRWMIRLGLYLYDWLARGTALPRSQAIDLRRHPAGRPLDGRFTYGFTYTDCVTDDSRLVIATARDAADRGGVIRTRTEVRAARVVDGLWRVEIEDRIDVSRKEVVARIVVNAAGPWAEAVAANRLGAPSRHHMRLVKGSHIVVPKLTDGEQAYILQNSDGRVVFVLPFAGAYSLIGTTEVAVDGDPGGQGVDDAEIDYLLAVARRYFKTAVGRADVHWSFCGVRPLFDDSSANATEVSREHALEWTEEAGAPLLTILGGKITMHRRVAEEAVDRLAVRFPAATPAWTSRSTLPGGDLAGRSYEAFATDLRAQYGRIPADLVNAIAARHGSLAGDILGQARTQDDLGKNFGGGLFERELRHFLDREWAREAEDVLWRRGKFGLAMSANEQRALAEYF